MTFVYSLSEASFGLQVFKANLPPSVCVSHVYVNPKLSPVQITTKFGPEAQNNLVMVSIFVVVPFLRLFLFLFIYLFIFFFLIIFFFFWGGGGAIDLDLQGQI